jgi:HSP20 family protein
MAGALARTQNGGAAERMAPWTPFRDLLGFDPFRSPGSNWGFEYDVTRTQTGYEVEVPVPGFKPDQIEVTFKDGVLTVNGKNDRRTFARSFTVPEDVDIDNIDGQVNDGMLVLTLNRLPEAQPKRITVKSK